MKIVFMGTPDLAVTVLDSIVNSRHEVTAVVTREDKPKGRGKEVSMPPVKEYALEHGLTVFQPAKIKTPESIATLKTFEADIFVVAAYGQILSQEILDMPAKGCINVHTSLLPKYRGSAPIQWAIIEGETMTGVSVMQMDAGMDTGPVLFTEEVPVADDETGGTLHDKLAEAGAKLIVKALDEIEAGNAHPVKQDSEAATYAKMLDKKMGHINFAEPAVKIERMIRGLDPWPGTFTFFGGKTLKIWKAYVCNEECREAPGTVIGVEKDAFTVSTGEGALRITEVQLEGRKRMQTGEFMRGCKIEAGDILG
ncbi:MAG: methionyl-tRNA formyltransferase [Lachnospiraceae bacterium]|nr:methionyl-tRNA formyltransferase [Lachnospiraceae bacterium]